MSMSIDKKVGDKIIVTIKSIQNGTHFDQLDADVALKIGNKYTIEKIEPHDFHTNVWVKEVPGIRFNSVMFDDL